MSLYSLQTQTHQLLQQVVCEAVCVMLGIKPNRIPDPDDPSKRIMDYWGPSQRMLGDPEFINQLKNYDKDSIPVKVTY
jgi:dynein heavy chain, axonemal